MNKNNKIKENKIVLSKDKKIIIILSILTILLFMFGIVLLININKNQSQIRELQSQTTNLNSIISSLNNSNNDLSSKIENNKSKIEELENNNNQLQSTKEEIEKEKDSLKNKNANLETDIKQLKRIYSSLNSKISSTQNAVSNNKSVEQAYEVGMWSSTVTYPEYSQTTNKREEVTTITEYNFKDNGDFYINREKIGTYKNGSIFFKDPNDSNYRTALYKIYNNTLYVNLYKTSRNIYVSTSFYECTKK